MLLPGMSNTGPSLAVYTASRPPVTASRATAPASSVLSTKSLPTIITIATTITIHHYQYGYYYYYQLGWYPSPAYCLNCTALGTTTFKLQLMQDGLRMGFYIFPMNFQPQSLKPWPRNLKRSPVSSKPDTRNSKRSKSVLRALARGKACAKHLRPC